MLLRVKGNDTATMTLGFGNIFFRNRLQSEQIIFNLFELSRPAIALEVDCMSLNDPKKKWVLITQTSFYDKMFWLAIFCPCKNDMQIFLKHP